MGVQIQGDTGNVIATKGTFSGDVGIAGTLTYEDVTNIDSVGLVTARNGIEKSILTVITDGYSHGSDWLAETDAERDDLQRHAALQLLLESTKAGKKKKKTKKSKIIKVKSSKRTGIAGKSSWKI